MVELPPGYSANLSRRCFLLKTQNSLRLMITTMNEKKTQPLNFASGNIVREALASDEIRAAVRERLCAEGKLPHYTRERMTQIVRAFLAEEKAKEDGIQETNPTV